MSVEDILTAIQALPPADQQRVRAELDERLTELIAWYSSPEFTRRLLEHMHKAKKKAIEGQFQ